MCIYISFWEVIYTVFQIIADQYSFPHNLHCCLLKRYNTDKTTECEGSCVISCLSTETGVPVKKRNWYARREERSLGKYWKRQCYQTKTDQNVCTAFVGRKPTARPVAVQQLWQEIALPHGNPTHHIHSPCLLDPRSYTDSLLPFPQSACHRAHVSSFVSVELLFKSTIFGQPLDTAAVADPPHHCAYMTCSYMLCTLGKQAHFVHWNTLSSTDISDLFGRCEHVLPLENRILFLIHFVH